MALENASNMTAPINTAAEELHLSLRSALESTHSTFLTNLVDQPAFFFITIVIAGFILSYLFVFLCKTIIKAFTRRTETNLDDMLLERLQHPVAISLFLLCVSVALVPLSLSSLLASITNKLLISGNILLVGTIVNRIIATLVMHYGEKVAARTQGKFDDHALPIVRKIITATVYIIAALFVLMVWGVQIAPLLAGAGIAGIAIAFAMQESLKNLFGGIALAFDGAYGPGDRIKLADGTVGKVIDVSLRSTKIRTFTGDLIVVPNGKIANENFQTYAQPTAETLVVVPFSVAYGSDIEKTRKVVFSCLEGIPNMFEDKPRDMKTTVDFLEMGPYSLNMRVTFWVNDYAKSWDAKLDATNRIYAALTKNKIDIPFPTQTVFMHQEKVK